MKVHKLLRTMTKPPVSSSNLLKNFQQVSEKTCPAVVDELAKVIDGLFSNKLSN